MVLKRPVTLVTADSEATKYDESCIGVERSQSDIRESDSSVIQVTAEDIVKPGT